MCYFFLPCAVLSHLRPLPVAQIKRRLPAAWQILGGDRSGILAQAGAVSSFCGLTRLFDTVQTQKRKIFSPHVIIINSGAKIFFLQRPENEALCKVICPFLFCRGPRLCDLACTPFFPDCFQAGGSSAASSYLLLGPTFLLHVAREFPRHERERLESRGGGGCWTITEHPGFRDDDDNCRIFSKV